MLAHGLLQSHTPYSKTVTNVIAGVAVHFQTYNLQLELHKIIYARLLMQRNSSQHHELHKSATSVPTSLAFASEKDNMTIHGL